MVGCNHIDIDLLFALRTIFVLPCPKLQGPCLTSQVTEFMWFIQIVNMFSNPNSSKAISRTDTIGSMFLNQNVSVKMIAYY